jgi:hypothetical protein
MSLQKILGNPESHQSRNRPNLPNLLARPNHLVLQNLGLSADAATLVGFMAGAP